MFSQLTAFTIGLQACLFFTYVAVWSVRSFIKCCVRPPRCGRCLRCQTVSEVSEMAPKGAQDKQWRAALDAIENAIRQELMYAGTTNDTPEDEKYMESGEFFEKTFPDGTSKAGFYLQLHHWLQVLGANVQQAVQAHIFVFAQSPIKISIQGWPRERRWLVTRPTSSSAILWKPDRRCHTLQRKPCPHLSHLPHGLCGGKIMSSIFCA